MPSKLRKLKITRVAVCRQGANYDETSGVGAHILLFKAADSPIAQQSLAYMEPDGDEATPLDYATRGQQHALWSCLWEKWERFCGTFYDVVGDGDDDNVAHLPILVTSIGQFQTDVERLLADLGLTAKMAPALTRLTEVTKAGATMAGHRLTRLKEAITQLQQILEECTPDAIDRPGVSAADVLSIPYVMKHKGGARTVRTTTESDQGHRDTCDDKDCDNPAHDRLQKEQQMAETLDGVTTRAERAEAQVAHLTTRADTAEAQVVKLTEVVVQTEADLAAAQTALSALQAEMAISKMSPEEQRDKLLEGMPDLVRKSYLDQESRLSLVEKANRDLQAKDARLEYIQKTVAFQSLGFVPDDHWEILKEIDAMTDRSRTELLRLLSAQAAQAPTSPWTTTVGAHGVLTGSGAGSTAEGQLLALAETYQKEHGGDLGTAIGAIAKQHPDLWARDQHEKRFRNRVETR